MLLSRTGNLVVVAFVGIKNIKEMSAEEYFKVNVIWNGTVIMNPIQLMVGYHNYMINKPNCNHTNSDFSRNPILSYCNDCGNYYTPNK